MKSTATSVQYILAILILSATLAACTPTPDTVQTPSTPVASQQAAVNQQAAATVPADAPTEIITEGNIMKLSENYTTPGGKEQANFIFTMDGNTIEKVELDIRPNNATSKIYQGKFASGINEVVAGKDITTLDKIDRVAGSSLTPKAFNQAVAKLAAELKA